MLSECREAQPSVKFVVPRSCALSTEHLLAALAPSLSLRRLIAKEGELIEGLHVHTYRWQMHLLFKARTVQCKLPGYQWASAILWCGAQGAWVTEKLLRPRPVTAELLAERIEGVDAAMGAAIVRALSSEGLLNATGFLVEDPRFNP